jgi:hypothetical protein
MNPGSGADLLSQLRDIHAAPAAPFWPPAPGWWVLALVALLLITWLLRGLLRRWRRSRRQKALLARLGSLRDRHDPVLEPQAWISSLNRLLKIIAMRADPEATAAPLRGEDWVAFLGRGRNSEPFQPLATGPYEPHPDFDDQAVEDAAREWIRQHG